MGTAVRHCRILGLALITLAFANASPASAWDGVGHQIVALIAESKLTPEANAGIGELLGDARISDAEIANWADEVRRQRSDTGPWHFVNIPVNAERFNRERDGRDGQNVIDVIEKQARLVADVTRAREDRAEALKFLVHLVADLHQPLHCAERHGDRGGNGRLVFFEGQRQAVNLHKVWDSLLLRTSMQGQRAAAYAEQLKKKIAAAAVNEWSSGTVEQWANEAHRVAVSRAYESVPADGPPPRLTPEYVRMGRHAVDEQLLKAGIRLAVILNQCWPSRR